MKVLAVNFFKTPNSSPKHKFNGLNRDTVSFGHNYHKGEVRKSDEEFLGKLINRYLDEDFKKMDEQSQIRLTQSFCNNEVRIIHDKSSSAKLNTFSVDKGYRTMCTGVMHYDDKNELQFVTVKKCPDGSMFDYGEMSVFDKDGNEVKHLSAGQVKILLGYRGNLANNLNNVLRYYREDNPFLKDEIAVMDSLFRDPRIYSVTKDTTYVYRGLSVNPDIIGKWFSAGNIYQDKAFLSTSDRPECALPEERNVLLKIEVPKGKKFIDMHLLTSVSDFYRNEHEMLFDRNQKMIVKSYDPKTNIVNMKFL